MKHTTQLSIVLLATQKEYQSGDVTACLDKYFKTNASVDKKIDLHIFFNKGEGSDYNDLLDYQNCENINEVRIKSHKLEGINDLYARTPEELDRANINEMPDMGCSAGPNNLFFNSMIPLMSGIHRDYLMLESDTFPIQDFWLDKIINYCDNTVFMIAGSSYKGQFPFPDFDTWTGHLNGVAIYRASQNLSTFFKLSQKTIAHHVKYSNPFMSFDVAMHYFSCTLLGRKFFNNRNLPFNQLIDSPIISNYSLADDTVTSVEEVKKQHPDTIILHQKTNKTKQPEYLPVFHHIAKIAGTYVLSWAQMLCRRYHIMQGADQQKCWTGNRIRRLLVQLIDGKQLTVIYYTPTDLTGSPNGILEFCDGEKPDGSIDYDIIHHAKNSHINSILEKGGDEYTNIISSEKFIQFCKSKDIIPFCVIIDPMNPPSSLEARKYIDLITESTEIKQALHFTVLRDPFQHAQSLFSYLNSDDSSHEPTHNSIEAKKLEDYIQSNEVEDSWFLRSLIDIPDTVNINEHHFNLAEEKYLKNFLITDISKVDNLINDVFHKSYGISQLDVEGWILKDNINKNSTSKKIKIKFEDLDPTIQQKFLDRTYWDRKLWERYCK